MSKLERWLNVLIYCVMVDISIVWMVWPEDIVGTQELAMLIVLILWIGRGKDEK